jgi:hypothetical protein
MSRTVALRCSDELFAKIAASARLNKRSVSRHVEWIVEWELENFVVDPMRDVTPRPGRRPAPMEVAPLSVPDGFGVFAPRRMERVA